MESKRIPYYLGIDLCEEYAMISFYQLNKDEPETVSTTVGSQIFQIPLVLAKRKGLGQWYYGDDATKMAKNGEVICVDFLLKRAINNESVRMEEDLFSAEELLILYLKKLIQIPQKMGLPSYCDRLVITVERLTRENMELFWRIIPKLGFEKNQFMLIDHKESFYYFALSQKSELWIHDVFLMHLDKEILYYYALNRNMQTNPQVITIAESKHMNLGQEKDSEFLKIQQKAFDNKIVSSVYLVGDGFEGDWMRESLNYLCRGRRAFMGNNLFSKGACYAGVIRDYEDKWPYIYMGENEMKFNISLKIKNQGNVEFYSLITAGKNWFECTGECEVILSGDAEIDFWKQLPNSREAKIETLELTDLPKRPNRATRIRITAKPIADDKVEIEIKDLGFGEICRSTDKIWRYTMSI